MPRSLLIACDGTKQRDYAGDARVSNVVRLKRLYPGTVVYEPGPGGRGPLALRILRWITGLDARRIGLRAARRALQVLEDGPRDVDLLLYSRGWVCGLVACEELARRGVWVRSLVGWDAVYSLGIPLRRWDWIDRRYPQEPPPNVGELHHLVAQHEDDIGFNVHLFDPGDPRNHQVQTCGDHGEHGGGSWQRWWGHSTVAPIWDIQPPVEPPPPSDADRWGTPLRDLPDWLPEWVPPVQEAA